MAGIASALRALGEAIFKKDGAGGPPARELLLGPGFLKMNQELLGTPRWMPAMSL